MAASRRNPVAQGGMWSTPTASYSKETQNLLKGMMKESKLTNFQQRQLTQVVKEGSTLPDRVHPTTSARPRMPPQPRPQSKIINARTYQPQIRSKEQIESNPEVYEREKFAPKPQTKFRGFYEKDKDRLANIMAFGEDIQPPDWRKVLKRAELSDIERKEVDRFDELQEEITERQQFMEQMEQLGKGDQYRTIIATEISQLLREMEVIDKKRTAELNKYIEQDDKKKRKERDSKQKGSG